MIAPRVTWAALGTGLVAVVGAADPLFQALAGLPGPVDTLFGPVVGPKVSAACAIVAAVALGITARGRSIDPATDAGTNPLTQPPSAGGRSEP